MPSNAVPYCSELLCEETFFNVFKSFSLCAAWRIIERTVKSEQYFSFVKLFNGKLSINRDAVCLGGSLSGSEYFYLPL